MVKNHLKKKNSRIQIQIQIFTKIESIRPCHTHNLSTKFHPNPSKTFWDIVLYISLAKSLNGEESLKKLSDPDPDSDLHQNWINSSLSHTQHVYQVSCESIYKQLFEISCKISFLALSLNGEESLIKLSDPDLDLDLHQNWINSSLSHTQHVHQVSSESVHNFWDIVLSIIFGPMSQWWRTTLEILVVGSGSRSSPKSNQFVLVTHQTCPQSFIRIQ